MDFEEWSRARLPSLLRLATALCRSRQSGEDLVQDVLVKAYVRWAQIQGLEHPEAYLRQMLIHEHLSWRRRLASALRRDTAARPTAVGQRRPFDQEWADRVELADEINKLSPRQRTVVVLRYLDDLTIAETAETMQCTESTVRAHTSRALANLRVGLPTPAPTAKASSTRPPCPVEDRHAH